MELTGIETEEEQQSLFTICLMAAFADGMKSEVERSEVKRISETLNTETMPVAQVYQDVLYGKVPLDKVVLPLKRMESRTLAYELAYCVCEADAAINQEEKAFLERLRTELKLEPATASTVAAETVAVAQAPLAAAPPVLAPPVIPTTAPGESELDRMILNYSILTGALELLPDTLATLAIVPLQMRMVYQVGKHYRFDLDRGHIKEFLATVGIGLTAQVVEGFARKLASKFVGRWAGAVGRRLTDQLASSGVSFSSTYALGHVAKQYYAGGRRLSIADLKTLFRRLTGEAMQLQTQHLPQIQQKAGTIDVSSLVKLIGNTP